MKYIKLILAVLLLLLFIAFLLVVRMGFKKSDAAITTYFKKQALPIGIHSVAVGNRSIRYVEHTHSSDTVLLFIHGAPGGLDAFFPYLSDSLLRAHFSMIAVDRLGYGESGYGVPEPSIEGQAKSLLVLLEKYPSKKWILVGHSFGAPIAAYMGYLAPAAVERVILLGATVDAQEEKNEWLAKGMNTFLLRPLLSKAWKVCIAEKIRHSTELQKIEYIWREYPVPLLAIHGKKDKLVPYSNIKFLFKNVAKERFKCLPLPNEGHLFIFTKPGILRGQLVSSGK